MCVYECACVFVFVFVHMHVAVYLVALLIDNTNDGYYKHNLYNIMRI